MARRPRFEDRDVEVWNLRPFKELLSGFAAVRNVAVPRAPLGLIIGDAGLGKTFCANVYAVNQKAEVIIATTPPRDILTARILLDSIADALGLEPRSYRYKSEVFDAICSQIIERDVYTIIDEADRLRSSNADMLREIAEVTSRPLCFLGCPSVESVLARVAPTHHRIAFRHLVKPTDAADLQAALAGRSLDAHTGRKLTAEVVDAIFDVTKGNLRNIDRIVHLMRGAQQKSTGAPVDATVETVRYFAKQYLYQRAA